MLPTTLEAMKSIAPNPTPSDTIPDEVVDRILLADKANIARKARAGKPLTRAERELLERSRTSLLSSPPKYVKTDTKMVGLLIEHMQMSMTTAYTWLKKLATLKHKEHGWPARSVLDAVGEKTYADASGPIATAREKKILLECDLLQMRKDQLSGELVPVEVLYRHIVFNAELTKTAFARWLQQIRTRRRDPELLQWGEKLCDDILAQISERYRLYGEQVRRRQRRAGRTDV